jgi:hypothetical protein
VCTSHSKSRQILLHVNKAFLSLVSLVAPHFCLKSKGSSLRYWISLTCFLLLNTLPESLKQGCCVQCWDVVGLCSLWMWLNDLSSHVSSVVPILSGALHLRVKLIQKEGLFTLLITDKQNTDQNPNSYYFRRRGNCKDFM